MEFIYILITITIILCIIYNFKEDKINTSICVIIPVTSRNRDWKNFNETYLFNYFCKTFFEYYNPDIKHLILLGIDDDDKLFNNINIKNDIKKYIQDKQNVEIDFISTNGIKKGHTSEYWNRLIKEGINRDYEYFLQCGDDIEFYSSWENDFIKKLQSNNNIGVIGFADILRLKNNKNDKLVTQSFVHKTHYYIFNYFFPSEIDNWGTDDWLTGVYKLSDNLFYDLNHKIKNSGGKPRYTPLDNRKLWNELIQKDYKKIINYQK